MKHKTLLLMLASSAMAFSVAGCSPYHEPEVREPDNATYENQTVVDYSEGEVLAPVRKNAAKSASSFKLHYHNDDGANVKNSTSAGREFWVWCDGVNGSAFQPDAGVTATDMTLTIDFSGQYADFANKKSISFIIKFKDSWVGQSENVVIKYEDYEPNESGCTEIWCIPGEGNAVEVYKTERETTMDRFQLATFEDWRKISVIATDVPTSYRLYALTGSYMRMGSFEQKQKLQNYLVAEGSNPNCTNVKYNSVDCKKFEITLNYTAKVNVQYYLEGVFPNWQDYTKTKYVSFHKLYTTSRFKEYYNYDGDDLGATYNDANSTTFKVWAPTAARVRLYLYNSGTNEEIGEKYNVADATDDSRAYNMAFRPGGVWEVTIKGKDLHQSYYNYFVVNSLGENLVTDPYAKACGVNGDRGMICDWSRTNPEGWDNVPDKWDGVTGYDIKTPNELSIYETHIRDLTMDASWNGKKMPGTYSAFVEKGTTVTKNSKTATTGFDHLEEMGFKAIHLLPVFDHDNNEEIGNRVYNWGYNPKNYNCVEGSYATDPYDGAARVKEFKEMVQAFATNANKTRIIMDVVYNHVSSAPGSCFNKLMPKYYFRYVQDGRDGAGNYYDGSGCGNEVKSEAPMMSKYIVDSLCWWAKEYKVKGFRFDLMGLINVGTIDAARKALYKIDPDILIYGEGWTGDGSGYDYGKGEVYQVHSNADKHDDPSKQGGGLSEKDRNLLGCMTAAVYRYLYPTANACYVAAFNDAGRGAIRGDNNLDNGWGFIDQGSGDVGSKSSTVADMMIGYHTGMGGNPNQCINYASCHDNYALFDQVMNGIADATYASPALACAAVSAVECAIMFSNGIALMQGGEEVFRTKQVTSAADKKLVKESDSHTIKGKLVTHNAYNLSDDVNAFRWDRKIAIGSTSTLEYVQSMAKAIKLRSKLAKYDYDALSKNSPFSDASPFNVWGQGDGSTAIGVKNDHYFCFVCGINNTDQVTPFDTSLVQATEFSANGKGYDNVTGGVKMWWFSTVCFRV